MSLSNQFSAQHTGFDAEIRAKKYLQAQGLTFYEQNYKVKLGEIDLIFKQQQQWIFVEVKYRHSNSHGCAAEQFTLSKRRKVINAIYCFLKEQHLNPEHTNMRIDLVAIDGDNLNWIRNV